LCNDRNSSADIGIPISGKSLITGIPVIKIIEVKVRKYGGTWVHPRLAIYLAQWISPKFAVKANEWLYRSLTNDVERRVSLANMQYLRYMVSQALFFVILFKIEFNSI
jgi:hypothetical protein